MSTLSPDIKTLLQCLPPNTGNELYDKLKENTVLTKADLLQFHALIHRIHEQFHDSEVSISKRCLQKKRSGRKCMKKKAYQSLV